MFIRFFLLLIIVEVFNSKILYSQDLKEIRKHVEYLGSDLLEGRYPGTTGDSLSAAYVIHHFKQHKVQCFQDGFLQNIELQTGVELTACNKLEINNELAHLFIDFCPLSISANSESLVGAIEFNRDSLFEGIQFSKAKGRWIIVDAQDSDLSTRDLMRGATKASDNQILGIMFIVESSNRFESNKSNRHNPLEMNSLGAIINTRGAVKADIPMILITDEFYKRTKNKSLNISDTLAIYAQTDVKPVRKTTHNIIGFVKGERNPDNYIVVGAHYDHLGYGGPESGSREPEKCAIHYGADDNASGTAAVLSLSTEIASNPLGMSVIFVAFGAEEMGLIGSQYMVSHLPIPKENIKAMFNFDMVGRMEENVLNIGGVKTAIDFNTIIDTITTELVVKTSPFGSGPSDHSSFNSEEIPVLYFNTGIHTDYHTPNDNVSKINYQGIYAVVRYALKILEAINTKNANLTYNPIESPNKSGNMSSLKVTLGIIPDVTGGDNKGLVIQGVNPNGVAKRAELLKGDRIVNIDGTVINNIYDYMEKLQTIKPRQVSHITLIRDGKEMVILVQF